MRWFVVPAIGLQACCVPLPFPHDHDDTPVGTDTPDDDGGPHDTAEPPPLPDTTDTGEGCPDGHYLGPTIVAAGDVVCEPDRALLSADLFGWADHAVVFLQETGALPGDPQWSEEHPLDDSTRDACGFQERRKELISELGVFSDAWVPGVSSVFPCESHLSNTAMMTVAVYVEDVDDGAGDCLAFGHDPAGLVAGAYDEVRLGMAPSFDLGLCVFAETP